MGAAGTDRRVVLVTGAARRIGAAIARSLHAAGWSVVLHAHRSGDDLQALVAELEAHRPGSALGLRADLHDAAQIATLAREAAAWRGGLDALVNNASSYYATPLAQLDVAQVDELIGSNLRAPLLLSRAVLPWLRPEAAIVNLIDVHARRVQAGYAPYLAAKSGLWTLTEALALELAPAVRVNGVAPGHMLHPIDASWTEAQAAAAAAQVPLGRLGGAEEIARAVRFLLSGDAAYITGVVLAVDGGLRLR